MNRLAVSESALEEWLKKLPRQLKRLAPDPSYILASYQLLGLHEKAITLHQGQKGGVPYDKCRVSLLGADLSVAYFEIWQYVGALKGQRGKKARLLGRSACYQLQKAYLHIFSPMPSGDEKEVLFLHCDPQEAPDSEHYRYKVAPHLHFEVAGYPWKDAHVPLCDGWQEQVLKNLDVLDAAIARAVDFIADQVVPLAKRR
jgi:hypothetical protein